MKYKPTFNEKEQVNTFNDADNVTCVTLDDAKQKYPQLNWDKIEKRFVWDIEETFVMALADLKLCIKLEEQGLQIEDINYEDVAHCSVCGEVLLPDDEAYTDHATGDTLCDAHARFDEETNSYVKIPLTN